MDLFITLAGLGIGSKQSTDNKNRYEMSPIHIFYRAYQALQYRRSRRLWGRTVGGVGGWLHRRGPRRSRGGPPKQSTGIALAVGKRLDWVI